MAYKVYLTWDSDARVWVARSDDIPGLNTEHPDHTQLIARVLAVAPELIELNNAHRNTDEVIFLFDERREHLSAAA